MKIGFSVKLGSCCFLVPLYKFKPFFALTQIKDAEDITFLGKITSFI